MFLLKKVQPYICHAGRNRIQLKFPPPRSVRDEEWKGEGSGSLCREGIGRKEHRLWKDIVQRPGHNLVQVRRSKSLC